MDGNVKCILCGKQHGKGTPHDFTGADPILSGKINIPKKEQDEQRKPERPPKYGK